MIIGIDGSRAFSKNRTGTENYSFELIKAIAKIDQKTSFKLFIRPGNDPKLLKLPSNFEVDLIDFPRLWTQVGLGLETFQTKLDVLFVPSHTLPLIKKPGLKTVVTVHDLGAEYLPQMHQIKQRLYLNWMTKHQLKGATKIIAVSNATKEDLIKRAGIDSKKIEVIYEGVDREIFKSIKTDVLINRLKHFGLERNNYFLFVGTIQPRKNLERLITAFSRFLSKYEVYSREYRGSKNLHTTYNILNTKLVLAGGKGWLSDEIYELPKKLGIEKRVKFLGRVEDEDLPYLYSGARALTFPSLFEGFGLPILEAFSCECPVITSNSTSLSEIASNSAYLVNPESEEEIKKGMEFFMKEKNRQDFIKKGLNRVKLFTWEKAAGETLKVLKEV